MSENSLFRLARSEVKTCFHFVRAKTKHSLNTLGLAPGAIFFEKALFVDQMLILNPLRLEIRQAPVLTELP